MAPPAATAWTREAAGGAVASCFAPLTFDHWDPRTGEPVAIEARRVVTFHASPKLKEQVQATVGGAPAAGPGAGLEP